MKTLVETLVIGEGGVLRLPQELLDQANPAAGSVVTVSVSDAGEVAISDDAGTPWLDTPEWHEAIREARAELAAGKTEFFASDEAFTKAVLARPNA